jgi:hypothetical protein
MTPNIYDPSSTATGRGLNPLPPNNEATIIHNTHTVM